MTERNLYNNDPKVICYRQLKRLDSKLARQEQRKELLRDEDLQMLAVFLPETKSAANIPGHWFNKYGEQYLAVVEDCRTKLATSK